ncbi:hypothetical protein BDW_04265 [Bdellovibrio bacteriovorus W]|nr:hypothetical protein BDW_04265 [Bdellovibrio bacteriovorus W]
MRNAQVIEFPKKQSARKRLQDKVQEQKTLAALSIASVLITSVFLNQYLTRGSEALETSGNRGVASISPAAFAADVKWEQDLAKRFSKDNNLQRVAIAENPTLRDELVFGYLEGKYGMKLAAGQIESLEFIDAQAGELPMKISDRSHFLKKYASAFGFDYKQVSLAQSEEAKEVYSLINSNKEIVGQALFQLDDHGRVQSLKFHF